jgi:hypothetical protein
MVLENEKLFLMKSEGFVFQLSKRSFIRTQKSQGTERRGRSDGTLSFCGKL